MASLSLSTKLWISSGLTAFAYSLGVTNPVTLVACAALPWFRDMARHCFHRQPAVVDHPPVIVASDDNQYEQDLRRAVDNSLRVDHPPVPVDDSQYERDLRQAVSCSLQDQQSREEDDKATDMQTREVLEASAWSAENRRQENLDWELALRLHFQEEQG